MKIIKIDRDVVEEVINVTIDNYLNEREHYKTERFNTTAHLAGMDDNNCIIKVLRLKNGAGGCIALPEIHSIELARKSVALYKKGLIPGAIIVCNPFLSEYPEELSHDIHKSKVLYDVPVLYINTNKKRDIIGNTKYIQYDSNTDEIDYGKVAIVRKSRIIAKIKRVYNQKVKPGEVI